MYHTKTDAEGQLESGPWTVRTCLPGAEKSGLVVLKLEYVKLAFVPFAKKNGPSPGQSSLSSRHLEARWALGYIYKGPIISYQTTQSGLGTPPVYIKLYNGYTCR